MGSIPTHSANDCIYNESIETGCHFAIRALAD